jgi:dephospho-CoA kinase
MENLTQKSTVICITGGIGSGKSVVSAILSNQGIPVYHADQRAKELYEEDAALKSQVLALFGNAILNEDQSINRKALANQVFNNPENLHKLNGIVHPAVKQDYLKWLETHKSHPLVAREVAILFESKTESTCDFIVSISAPEDIRIKRVMARDQSTENNILDRMQHQWSDEERNQRSHFIIRNSGEELLIPQVAAMLQQVKSI